MGTLFSEPRTIHPKSGIFLSNAGIIIIFKHISYEMQASS